MGWMDGWESITKCTKRLSKAPSREQCKHRSKGGQQSASTQTEQGSWSQSWCPKSLWWWLSHLLICLLLFLHVSPLGVNDGHWVNVTNLWVSGIKQWTWSSDSSNLKKSWKLMMFYWLSYWLSESHPPRFPVQTNSSMVIPIGQRSLAQGLDHLGLREKMKGHLSIKRNCPKINMLPVLMGQQWSTCI
jgi:hypothetical protein